MKIHARKLAVVAALVAFTTGVSGYFMGLLQTDRVAEERRSAEIPNSKAELLVAPSAASAPEAPRYADLRDRTRQPNHAWRSSLADLSPTPAFTAATPPLSAVERDALLARRTARRAYTGAPPTVPHPIDQRSSASCLACHGTPTRIAGRDVPQLSHPAYTNCIQCHAPAAGPGPALASPPPAQATPVLANTFTGLASPAAGTRAYAGAPPVMPHTTAMRQNCVTCHGPGGSSALKTTHPQRQNCLQCHATDATRETLPPPIL
jgi:nitrate reductase (cytochrome), electron transfer subunit